MQKKESEKLVENEKKTMHFSFDDVSICIEDIKYGKYISVFDQPFFNYLMYLHEKSGLTVSLYCYTEIFKNLPIIYRKELGEAATWLKFGIHAPCKDVDYSCYGYSAAQKEYQDFVDEVYNFTGNYDSIDRFPRLHYFAASKEAILGMKETDYGIVGLLTSEEKNPHRSQRNRISYCLKKKNIGMNYDENTNLWYQETNLRCDWLCHFTDWLRVYPTYFMGLKSLLNFKMKKKYNIEVFSHEWKTDARIYMAKIAEWGGYCNVNWGFWQEQVR